MPKATSFEIPCKVCERGIMIQKKKFRMSAPVVAIGFILVIPSIVGLCISALIFVAVLAGASATVDTTAKDKATAEMREHDIPEPVISAVVSGQDEQVDKLIDDMDEVDRSWVRDAQEKIHTSTASNAASGIGMLFGSGLAVTIGVISFVGGLLGWLLLMRKRVLQCSICGATIAAS